VTAIAIAPVAITTAPVSAVPKRLPVVQQTLTSSRLKCYRRCPREHLFAYELGYRPLVEADAVRFGTLVHRALEAYWKAPQGRLDAALAALEAADGSDAFELAKARALMRGYDTRWGDAPYEVLAVEVEFTAPLVNPSTGAASKTWVLGGKIDAIVRDFSNGHVLICEHKTSSEDISSGSLYWKRLRLDAQVSAYYVGAKALGYDVTGCLYDVLGKPGLRPLKATPLESRKYTKDGRLYAGQRERDETPVDYEVRVAEDIAADPDAYYARGDVVRLERDLLDHAGDAWQLARQIRDAELARRAPRNVDACRRQGGMCPYWSVCSGEAALEDPTRYRLAQNVHPELSEDCACAG
jgi:hypothetical protein